MGTFFGVSFSFPAAVDDDDDEASAIFLQVQPLPSVFSFRYISWIFYVGQKGDKEGRGTRAGMEEKEGRKREEERRGRREEEKKGRREKKEKSDEEGEANGEGFVGEEGWRMLVEKTNITAQQSKEIKKYWAYWEIKLVYNGIFKPFAEPATKEQLQIAFRGQSHIRSTALFSQEKCRRAWKKSIHPLIVARMFEIMDPSLLSMATFASSVILFGKICRGSPSDRLSLLFTMMDIDDDGFISRNDFNRLFYLAYKSQQSPQVTEKVEMPKSISFVMDFLFSDSNLEILLGNKWKGKRRKTKTKKSVTKKASETELSKSQRLKKRISKAIDENGRVKRKKVRQTDTPKKREEDAPVEEKSKDGSNHSNDDDENEGDQSETIGRSEEGSQAEFEGITDLLQAVIILQRWWRREHQRRVIRRWMKIREDLMLTRAEEIRKEREANKNNITREKFNFFQIQHSHSESEDEADVGEDEGAGDDESTPFPRKSSIDVDDFESPRTSPRSSTISSSGSSLFSSIRSTSTTLVNPSRTSGVFSKQTLLISVDDDETAIQDETTRYFRALYAIHCEKVVESNFNVGDFIKNATPFEQAALLTVQMTHEVANIASRALNEPLHRDYRTPLADIRASLSLSGESPTGLQTICDIQKIIIEFTRRGEVPNALEKNEKFSQGLYQRLSGRPLREMRVRKVLWAANSWATALVFPKEMSHVFDATEWIVGGIILVLLNVLRLFRLTCSLSCFLDRPMCHRSALDLFNGLSDDNLRSEGKQGSSSSLLEDRIVHMLSNPNSFPSKAKFGSKALGEAMGVLKMSYALLNHVISEHWEDIQRAARDEKEEGAAAGGSGRDDGSARGKKRSDKGFDMLTCNEFQKLVLGLEGESEKQVSSLVGVFDSLKMVLEEPLTMSWNAQHFESELEVFDHAKGEFRLMWCKWFSGTLDIHNSVKDTEKLSSITLLEYVLVKADLKDMSWQFALPGEQTVILRAKDCETFQQWHKYFTLLISELGGNPFDSFAPPRSNVNAKWYVCGKDYYRRAAEMILSAKKCIFISDWWLSPEIYLIREGDVDFSEYQLDTLLKRMAEQGVVTYILVWKHTKVAIDLNSSGSVAYLRSLHPNIHGIAHPPSFPINWSHHQKLLIIDEAVAFVGGLDLCFGRYDDENYRLRDDNFIHTTWPGKDYYNPRICPGSPHDPFADAFNRRSLCRMPWQDVMCEVDGAAAWDVAKNFVQRWNHHREKKHPEIFLGPIVPSATQGTATVQALRSLSKWSGGTKTERSIYRAMRAVIENAKHYIYIENQYFISSLAGGGIKNGIAKYLVDRILLAHKRKEVFRVIIVLPVHPEGSLWDSPTLYIMKWQFSTISRGGSSMLETLSDALGAELVSQYVLFTCLRNYEYVKDQFHTEQVYVHTKLMIVDDEIVIVGSANINDRSLLGSRDSEIALLIEDKERVAIRMGGQLYQGRSFAHTLRKKLWSIHLGVPLDSDVLLDPIHDDCYLKLWRDRSIGNTLAYFGLFEGLGDNSISQMIGVRKMLLERQAKSEGKKGVEVDRKRAQTFGSMTMVNVYSLGFHHPLFSPPTDPWKIHVFCHCCDTVNVMSDSQACLECSKTFCIDCMAKLKCHLCQGKGKCPPNRSEGREGAKEYLANAIHGFCCCYPADYLKDCDLNDQILSKVVGRMVFQ